VAAVNSPQRIDVEAVLRPSRWAGGMQVIGAIPDYVATQLAIRSQARSVWLHQQTVTHICEQRHLTPRDVEFVLEYMPAAVLRPMFCGLERKGNATRLALAEFIRQERRYLYLAVKLLRARSGDDELWVSTAHPATEETLRRYMRSGRLMGVVGETRLEGGKTRTARWVS
jgi:hypothetical protein